MMMVTVQLALTGVNVLYKLVGSNGASLPILIAYRFLFAAATVVPLALVLERLFSINLNLLSYSLFHFSWSALLITYIYSINSTSKNGM